MSATPAKALAEITKKKNPRLWKQVTGMLAKGAEIVKIERTTKRYRVHFTDARLGACVTSISGWTH
jgi:hypothetical protein